MISKVIAQCRFSIDMFAQPVDWPNVSPWECERNRFDVHDREETIPSFLFERVNRDDDEERLLIFVSFLESFDVECGRLEFDLECSSFVFDSFGRWTRSRVFGQTEESSR